MPLGLGAGLQRVRVDKGKNPESDRAEGAEVPPAGEIFEEGAADKTGAAAVAAALPQPANAPGGLQTYLSKCLKVSEL